jgi:TolA-binding protein
MKNNNNINNNQKYILVPKTNLIGNQPIILVPQMPINNNSQMIQQIPLQRPIIQMQPNPMQQMQINQMQPNPMQQMQQMQYQQMQYQQMQQMQQNVPRIQIESKSPPPFNPGYGLSNDKYSTFQENPYSIREPIRNNDNNNQRNEPKASNTINFSINGKDYTVENPDPRMDLNSFIRSQKGLTGKHKFRRNNSFFLSPIILSFNYFLNFQSF